ncbi:MAG: ribonuclease P protein component [Burkholderia sp.]|nr:ribonuclease P protein component [Burkholderia sp.]
MRWDKCCITLNSFKVCQKKDDIVQDREFFSKKANLPKVARLLKTDEFSSVFRFRPLWHSAHFSIYQHYTGLGARLGLVVSKRYAPRAVTRNLIKRHAREAFRIRQTEFNGWDLLLRLHSKFDEKIMPSASSKNLSSVSSNEICELLDRVSQKILVLSKDKF